MTVSLNISITSPLDEKDHELLAGLAMMTLAIANHEGAIKTSTEEAEEEAEEAPPAPCGLKSEDGTMVCISKAGHRGRHAMRPTSDTPLVEVAPDGLPN